MKLTKYRERVVCRKYYVRSMSQLSTDMQKFLRQEFGIEAESFLTDTAKEYRVEITEFRKHINSYCDDLISRADSSLKANQKVATKKKLRDVCR